MNKRRKKLQNSTFLVGPVGLIDIIFLRYLLQHTQKCKLSCKTSQNKRKIKWNYSHQRTKKELVVFLAVSID